MILRALRLRHGRVALPRPPTPALSRSSRRQYSSEPQFVNKDASGPNLAPTEARRTVALNDPNHPVALDYAFFQHQKERTQHLGAAAGSHYEPRELLTNPPSPKDITLELLIASQSHLGHATSLWHPANAQHIFGIRGEQDPIHIISPDVTAAHLRRACKVVSGVTERGGLVLFVGTRSGQDRAVVRAAQLAKGCHLFTKWIPGSITNGQQILGRCAKKVVNEHDHDIVGFEDQLGTKAALKPDLVVCLNPLENYVLLHECGLNNIPTIGIIDTDANPTWVTYPIAANDDSIRCVQVIAGVLGRAGQEGQTRRLQKAREGIIDYPVTHSLNPPTRTERSDKRRQPQSRKPSAAFLAAQEALGEIDFPDDTVGVPVDQLSQDQALLQEAENAMREESEAVALLLSQADSADGLEEPTAQVVETNDNLDEAELGQQVGYSIRQSPGGKLYKSPLKPARTSPLPAVSDDEQRLSADDPESDISYLPSASEASGPKTYPAAPQILQSEEEDYKGPITDQQRQLSELDPEMEPTYAASPEDGTPPRRVTTEDLFASFEQDIGEEVEPDLEPEYDAAKMPGAKTLPKKDGQGESTWDQVTEVEKELGEETPDEVAEDNAERQKGPPGVAPEEPVGETPAEEEKEVKRRGRPPKAKK